MNPIPWSHYVKPHDDELLSSFLVRLSHANGQTPSRFVLFNFPGIQVWNRDIDRSATTPFRQLLASHCNIEIERVDRLILSQPHWEPRFERPFLAGIAMGINAIGVYHRTRRLHGLVFCASCLLESGYFRKNWRLVWATVCPFHQILYKDECQACGAPIAPHRSETSILECAVCKCNSVPPLEISTSTEMECTDLEKALNEVNQGYRVYKPLRTVSVDELRVAISLLHRAISRRRKNISWRSSDAGLLAREQKYGQAELMRVEGRRSLIACYDRLLKKSKFQIRHSLLEIGITTSDFPTRVEVPQCLHWVLEQLPVGSRRTRQNIDHPLSQDIANLHRRKLSGWRTARAKLLFDRLGKVL